MELHRGDAYEVLKGLPDCSVDSCVTDPPAGIAFMGKDWDRDKGGRNDWTDWLTDVMEQVYRVLKPGGHCLVWALPRTSHWTAWAVEDAGFEVRDVVTHHFGTGFPKSLDVSKAIDKAAGKEREVVGKNPNYRDPESNAEHHERWNSASMTGDVTAPATDDAERWEGFGTALKPASEHWVLARRPLEGTVAANVLEHGTGALNIDGCRISMSQADADFIEKTARPNTRDQEFDGTVKNVPASRAVNVHEGGRWPANLVLSHSPDCVQAGTREVKTGVAGHRGFQTEFVGGEYKDDVGKLGMMTYGKDGKEEMQAWECAPGCPVAELDAQSGPRQAGAFPKLKRSFDGTSPITFRSGEIREHRVTLDSGGASRFFYTAKASKRERGEGNDHPTVKPLALMRWLVRLVTPPGGTVLDPFMGSGTTGMAAKEEGFEFVGVELDGHYYDLAQGRIRGAAQED